MVFAATLLAFAYIFASTAVPAMAVFFRNLETGLWITDYNFTSTEEVGNPIVGARFDSSNSAIHSWSVEPYRGIYNFLLQNTGRPVAATAQDVELANLETARSGSLFNLFLVNTTDHDTWTIVAAGPKALAITAMSVENQPLILTHSNNLTNQLWTAYRSLRPAVAGRPISLEDLRPATRDEVLATAKEN